jgi:hypothetical protein
MIDPQAATSPATAEPGHPDIITRYLEAAEVQDFAALAACFTGDGTVVDEGITYQGHDAIIGWREQTASKWEYTTEVEGIERTDDRSYLVRVHAEGNFPGGQADLTYSFTLDGDLIAALSIVE